MKNWSLLIGILFIGNLLFAQSSSKAGLWYSKAQVSEDIQFLKEALTHFHPGLHLYISQTELDQSFEDFLMYLPEKVSEAYLQKSLAYLLAKIRCGHTYLNPWNMDKEIRKRVFDQPHYFPLLFKIIDHQIVVTHNLSEQPQIEAGIIIDSINGHSTVTILNTLKQVVKGDGHSTDGHRLNSLGLDNVHDNRMSGLICTFLFSFPGKQIIFLSFIMIWKTIKQSQFNSWL